MERDSECLRDSYRMMRWNDPPPGSPPCPVGSRHPPAPARDGRLLANHPHDGCTTGRFDLPANAQRIGLPGLPAAGRVAVNSST